MYYFIEDGKIKEGQEDTFSTIDYNEYMDVPHVSSISSFTAGISIFLNLHVLTGWATTTSPS